MASVPGDGDDRRSSTSSAYAGRRASSTWTRSTRPVRRAPKPRTGSQLRAVAASASRRYKRLTRTIDVPAGGATLSFWVHRDTEPNWDFFFVEAHTVGRDDWTTLPDAQRPHRAGYTGFDCPRRLAGCTRSSPTTRPSTATATAAARARPGAWCGGQRRRATATSSWTVDLAPLRGPDVEVSLTLRQRRRRPVRRRRSSTTSWSRAAPGSTSFEDDGDTLDGWTVPGAPAGSPANANDWIVGTVGAGAAAASATIAAGAVAREPEIIGFLSGLFGPVPVLGGGLDRRRRRRARLRAGEPDAPDLLAGVLRATAATRATRSSSTSSPTSGSATACRSTPGSDIWLNEGFATYAEWLWSGAPGTRAPRRRLRRPMRALPAGSAFWKVKIGDPGPPPVRLAGLPRGAMTLHALRKDRRRGLLPAAEGVGERATRRQRDDPTVHRARRADLRPAARRFFHTWLYAQRSRRRRSRAPARRSPPRGPGGRGPQVAELLRSASGTRRCRPPRSARAGARPSPRSAARRAGRGTSGPREPAAPARSALVLRPPSPAPSASKSRSRPRARVGRTGPEGRRRARSACGERGGEVWHWHRPSQESAHVEQCLADRRAGFHRRVGVGGPFEREALADDRLQARGQRALGVAAQRVRRRSGWTSVTPRAAASSALMSAHAPHARP